MSARIKQIFLNDFHKSYNAKFSPFANYLMPLNYPQGILKENLHVRNLVGVFDVSHMGQILISSNSQNTLQLEKIIPLNFRNMKLGKSFYSFILNKYGGIVDDIIISKFRIKNEEKIYIVYNASRKNIDEKIFSDKLKNFSILNNNCLFAVQGPLASKILDNINISTDDIAFMQIKTIKYFNEDIFISRTGYTGEDGFEISIPNLISKTFIKNLLKNDKIILCGLGSRDLLRLEAGLSLYGNELNESLTPVDSDLSWAIDKKRLKDCDFNGAAKITKQLADGINQKKIGIKILSKSILRSNMSILNNNQKVGIITSGGYSPNLNYSIGIGYLNSEFLNKNNNLNCMIRGKLEKIEISKLPFIQLNYKRGKNNE